MIFEMCRIFHCLFWTYVVALKKACWWGFKSQTKVAGQTMVVVYFLAGFLAAFLGVLAFFAGLAAFGLAAALGLAALAALGLAAAFLGVLAFFSPAGFLAAFFLGLLAFFSPKRENWVLLKFIGNLK